LIIALVGVHGVGKTTTAIKLREYGFKLEPLEAIHLVGGLDPVQRQTLFFTTYVSCFLKAVGRGGERIVFDSHPVLVLPYTEYWLGRAGLSADEIKRVLDSFQRVLSILPPIDLLVYMKPSKMSIIVERLLSRARPNAREEADLNYLTFIDKRLRYYLNAYSSLLAKRIIVVDGSLEVDKRVQRVLEEAVGESKKVLARRNIEQKTKNAYNSS